MSFSIQNFPEMIKTNQKNVNKHEDTINVSILRNITLEPISIPLEFYANQTARKTKIVFGNFDNVFQDSLDNRIISKKTDIVLIVTPLLALMPKLINEYSSMSTLEKQSSKEYVLNFVQSILNNIRSNNKKAKIIWLSFESLSFPAFCINDLTSKTGQNSYIRSLNSAISILLSESQNSYHLDADQILRRLGESNFYDWRFWHLNKALYSRNTLIGIAQHAFSFYNSVTGKTKKCLILDCDNTLWGGIVGEDSLAGIKLGHEYPSSCYLEFQKAIIELLNQGVILAICSKNNEQDVLGVFELHPDMQLKITDISAYQINWQDKATNILLLAEQLNIGLDSMVFIDDSEFEINLVRNQLPQVAAIWLDKSKPTEFSRTLKSLRYFDKLTVTQEDLLKTKMYNQEVHRKNFQPNNLDEYLSSMEIKANIFIATQDDIGRISQQTQKTNQFNLTTKRYSEQDISNFIQKSEYDVLAIKITDNFGDMGIVGTTIIKYNEKNAEIDTLLLSCRALGRRIESVFLNEIILYCAKKNKDKLIGKFTSTSKNIQVKDFYKSNKFTQTSAFEETKIYTLDLKNPAKCLVDFIAVDNTKLYENT
ncbi:MAG: FkbH-like protein [Alteromonadaceae bacterium]|jgi:FkbH-like protein